MYMYHRYVHVSDYLLHWKSSAVHLTYLVSLMQGHPFMASLTENRPLMISLVVSGSVVFVIASGIMPDLSATFEIVSFTSEVIKTCSS